MMLAQLRDAGVRQAVIQDMQKLPHRYGELLVAVSRLNTVSGHRRVSEVAATQGVTVEEAVINILLASEGRAIVSHEVLSPLNVEKALQSPHSIVSSNGAGYALDHQKTGDFVHPRNFGTFPRVLGEYVREKKILSLEEAVHKMTGKPAGVFGFHTRGLLRKNYFADIVIFDPYIVSDRATLDDPYQFPVGIEHVLVNGELAVVDGQPQGTLTGHVLRRQKKNWFGL
jgi:N-acyl-D-aspartate/D-glutamate deacylase